MTEDAKQKKQAADSAIINRRWILEQKRSREASLNAIAQVVATGD